MSKKIRYPFEIVIASDRSDRSSYARLLFDGLPYTVVDQQTSEWGDVVIRMEGTMIVLDFDHEKIKKKSPWLASFCEKSEKFYDKNYGLLPDVGLVHNLIASRSILYGKTRIQQFDQCDLLELRRNTKPFLKVKPQYLDSLKKFGLYCRRYITLQRGVNHHDKVNSSTKVWPLRHYEKFIKLCHEKYPDIAIVQLGYSKDLCGLLDRIDVNLVGKTSLEDILAILKCSLFHLDGECGMVHLKRFLNGQSVVLFGPTPMDVYAYPENINIKGNGCHTWCEWASNDWWKRCVRGFKEPRCMLSITPQMVLDGAEKILNEVKDYSYSVSSCLKDKDIFSFITSKNISSDAVIVDVFNRDGSELSKRLRKSFKNVFFFGSNFEYDAFQKSGGVQLEYGCLYNLAMPDDSADVLIWRNGEEVENQEYALKELFRVLKPGGTFIVSGVDFDKQVLDKLGVSANKEVNLREATVFSKEFLNYVYRK